ncbi:MAG: hypothetical protein KAU21_00765, partial [Gammaproteobacteria bacterium]|nr:hypothetical protein [Gammaproteobacteria bacterium]
MCDFEKINLDSNLMNDCTPSTDELDLFWQGILINMPGVFKDIEKDEEASIISRDARIPLCITIKFKLKKMIKYG